MMHYVRYIELKRTIEDNTRLLMLYTQGDYRFIDEVLLWLENVEKILRNNNLPEVSLVTGFRSEVMASGLKKVAVDSASKLQSNRKLQQSAGFEAISKTVDLLYPVLKKEHDRFAEAERILMQVLSFANMKGYLQTYTGSTLSQADLAKLWITLSSDNDLRGGVSNVEGMVGKYDSLIVLDQALSLFA